jgi:lysophospholipase L1-like esterase
MNKYRLGVGITLALALGLGVPAFAQEVLAVYGEAAQTKGACPPNWQFLWNARGAIGDARAYEPVPFDAGAKMFCFTNAMGAVDGKKPRINLAGPAAAQDPEKIARYWIAAYTLTNDSAGVVWLRNGNVSHRFGGDTNGITLKVYVNDTAQLAIKVPVQRRPSLFQQKLGKLKRGDVVYVMVGPGASAGGMFGLQFMLESRPDGEAAPPEAINIISPEITEVTPHRDPRGGRQKGYVGQHERFVESARQEQPGLVFLGDSITAGWPQDLLKERFGQYKPANNGISGDWVQGLRWRVANGIYDQIKPRVIVLLIGINNLSNGFTPEEVAQGTKRLVDDIRAKTPTTRILLLGIFPRGTSFVPPAGDEIRKVNALTARLADQQHVFFLDLADKLIEPDGSISREVFPDGLHPGRPGYLRWADAIAPTVAKLFEMK